MPAPASGVTLTANRRPIGALRLAMGLLLGMSLLAVRAPAQALELSGQVLDPAGAPLRGARVRVEQFEQRSLEPRTRGRYTLATARALKQLDRRLPRTATDPSGTWRVLVQDQLAALLTSGVLVLQLQIEHPDYASWSRSLGGDLSAANGLVAQLEPRREGDGFELQLVAEHLTKGEQQLGGLVAIRRPFHPWQGRNLTRIDWLEIPADGVLRFPGPAYPAGDLPAADVEVLAEAFHLDIWALGCDLLSLQVANGARQRVALEPAPWRARKILGKRAAPASPPIDATWELPGREFACRLDQPEVPMLGGEPPSRVVTGSGPVEPDVWDPDVPMFVSERGSQAGADGADDDGDDLEQLPRGRAGVRVQVTGTDGKPLFGALVQIEDRALQRTALDVTGATWTGPDGTARLDGLPLGKWFVRVHHPLHGEREGNIQCRADFATRDALQVLMPGPSGANAEREGLTGILRIAPISTRGDWQEVGAVSSQEVVIVRKQTGPDLMPMRVRGLPDGPTTCYVLDATGAGALWGDALAQSPRTAPLLQPSEVPQRRVLLHVQAPAGAPPPTEITVDLGDERSAPLFQVEALDAPGVFQLTARMRGGPWVRVRSGDNTGRVQLSTESDDTVTPVQLEAPPQPQTDEAESGNPGGVGPAGPGGGELRRDG